MRLSVQSASWIREAIPSVRSMTFVIALTCAISACSQSAGSPLAPSPGGSAPKPTITGVSPAFGSAAGGAIVTIIGTGFMSGMTVAFDDIKVTARQYPASSSTAFYTEAPPHAVGTVDLIVTNPDGQFQRLPAAYAYRLDDASAYTEGAETKRRRRAVCASIAGCAFTGFACAVVRKPSRDSIGGFD